MNKKLTSALLSTFLLSQQAAYLPSNATNVESNKKEQSIAEKQDSDNTSSTLKKVLIGGAIVAVPLALVGGYMLWPSGDKTSNDVGNNNGNLHEFRASI